MRARSDAGFTLIEIMVVVLILGLLAALVTQKFINSGDRGYVGAAKTQIKSLQAAVQTFRLDNGRYPTAGEGLAALKPPPPADLPRYDPEGYMDRIPVDPWGRPFLYLSDGRSFEIVSYGRDGIEGGDSYDADISNRSL
jgi:general secretion pathway protein G